MRRVGVRCINRARSLRRGRVADATVRFIGFVNFISDMRTTRELTAHNGWTTLAGDERLIEQKP
jgi:hypothetical protein